MGKKKSFAEYRGYLAYLPFLIIVLLYEILPLLQTVGSSLIGKKSGKFGLENFIKIFTTELYQLSIINSIQISLISALIGIIVAFIAAHCIHEASAAGKNRMTMILNMMSNFSGVPLAFAFMVLLGNAGVLKLVAERFSIPFFKDFDLYTGAGLRIVYIYFQIPLATLLLLPAFDGIKKEWYEAAAILHAKPFDYWFRIVIPNLMPSILGTLSVLFANAMAAYATAYSLILNNYALLSLQITSKYKGDVEIDRATGGALSVVMILLMVMATLINNYFTKKSMKGREA